MAPPIKPEINNKMDISNFDQEFTEQEISQTLIPMKNLELIRKNQDKFKDF